MSIIVHNYFGLRANGYTPSTAWSLAMAGHEPDAVIDYIILGA